MLSHPGRHCYVKVTSSCEIASKRIQGVLIAYFKINEKINKITTRKIIHYSCEGRIEKSVPRITVCHHSARLVMPNGGPRDGFYILLESYMLPIQRSSQTLTGLRGCAG